jgi:hypothetical protein
MKRLLAVACLSASLAFGQSLVIPHIAAGGSWKTTVAVFNTFSTDITKVSVIFRGDDGTKILVAVTGRGNVSSVDLDLLPQSSVYLEVLGTRPEVQVGWVEVVQLTGTQPVRGFAVFRQTAPGRPDFEAVSPGMRAASEMTFPFDNTNGLVTGFGVVNLAAGACTVGVTAVFDETGKSLTTDPRLIGTLYGNGHVSFVATDKIPELADRRGYVTFKPLIACGDGGMAMVGLRFNPLGPFTNLLPLALIAPDGR